MRMTVLHLPHAATVIPAEVRARILLDDAALATEVLRMTDWFTDELFALRGAQRVVHPVSRLVVDPERFEDDAQESMAARGMGVVYTQTSHGERLREAPDPVDRANLIDTWYRPHHAALTAAVDTCLQRYGKAVVLDCHSFPSKPLPYEPDQSPDRPEICIGTDAWHTPAWLANLVINAFTREGFTVAHNRPFAGALVPAMYYERDARVMAVMVEVNRGLYMDEATGERLATFDAVKQRIQACVERIESGVRFRDVRERQGHALPSRPLGHAFVEACRIAVGEHWCWKIGCTTCGCGLFRYALLELAQGKHPSLQEWKTHKRMDGRLQGMLGAFPRSFDLAQQRQLLDVLSTAPLDQFQNLGTPSDWLGFLGLALCFTEEAEAQDGTLTRTWGPQLDALVKQAGHTPPRALRSGGQLLRWQDLSDYEWILPRGYELDRADA